MPNNVYNTISIKSKNQEWLNAIERILEGENGKIDFNKLIPMPEHNPEKFWAEGALSPEIEERLGKENCWYWWSVKNWGTKWNAYDIDFEKGSGYLTYRFLTAWSQPIPIFERILEMFPNCNIVIDWEEEQGWGGVIELENGKKRQQEWDLDDIEKATERLRKENPELYDEDGDCDLWSEAINICRDS
jgi:hypothetical protein